jgi:hypothetical protein
MRDKKYRQNSGGKISGKWPLGRPRRSVGAQHNREVACDKSTNGSGSGSCPVAGLLGLPNANWLLSTSERSSVLAGKILRSNI